MPGPARTTDWRRLLLRMGAGSTAAFAELYDGLAPAVLTASRRALPDAGRAEDATWDVFVALWQDAATFDPQRHDAVGWVVLRVSMAIQRQRAGLASGAGTARTAVQGARADGASHRPPAPERPRPPVPHGRLDAPGPVAKPLDAFSAPAQDLGRA